MSALRDVVDEVLGYILPQFQSHRLRNTGEPFTIGLTGLQGSGKSTWASTLTRKFETMYCLNVVNISLDDLYHSRQNLARIRQENHGNPLLQTRGQPGTHDEILAAEFFASLQSGSGVLVPSFDKSRFDGQGDRRPVAEWRHVPPNPPIDVVIFEGWCLGFQPLHEDILQDKWEHAKTQGALSALDKWCTQTLGTVKLEHLLKINSSLRIYNETFMGSKYFHYFVHLDTDDLSNVYRWRLDQEHAQWCATGTGMSDEEVIRFVRGYMPSYELYLSRLRNEAFCVGRSTKHHLRVLLDRHRAIAGFETIM